MQNTQKTAPTKEQFEYVRYITFTRAYEMIFSRCMWVQGDDGYKFKNAAGVHVGFLINEIPFARKVICGFVDKTAKRGTTESNRSIDECGIIEGRHGSMGSGTEARDIPSFVIELCKPDGNKQMYRILAQQPKRNSTWGKNAYNGTKSVMIQEIDSLFQKPGGPAEMNVVEGVFRVNPSKNGGTIVTEESVTMAL